MAVVECLFSDCSRSLIVPKDQAMISGSPSSWHINQSDVPLTNGRGVAVPSIARYANCLEANISNSVPADRFMNGTLACALECLLQGPSYSSFSFFMWKANATGGFCVCQLPSDWLPIRNVSLQQCIDRNASVVVYHITFFCILAPPSNTCQAGCLKKDGCCVPSAFSSSATTIDEWLLALPYVLGGVVLVILIERAVYCKRRLNESPTNKTGEEQRVANWATGNVRGDDEAENLSTLLLSSSGLALEHPCVTTTWSSRSSEQLEGVCIICLEEMTSHQNCTTLHCKHAFHDECIKKRFKVQLQHFGTPSCPVCFHHAQGPANPLNRHYL